MRTMVQLKQQYMLLGFPEVVESRQCEECVIGKQARKAFSTQETWRATERLQLVHTDLCEPMEEASLGGNKYFFLLVDDYNKFSWVYFIKSKLETFRCFRVFKVLMEQHVGCESKALSTNCGGKFIFNEFKALYSELGIKRELTIPYTLQYNGVVQRKNLTTMEMARTLHKAKGHPKSFHAEVVATAVHLINITTTFVVMEEPHMKSGMALNLL